MQKILNKNNLNIFKRRSVREFKDKSIDDTLIKFILEAAMQAPSANDNQPWSFVVITQKEKLLEVSKELKYGNIIKQAPCAILVCGNPRVNDTVDEFWVQSCSAATENLLIALTEIELGGVWLGIYPREKRIEIMRRVLKVPENIYPFSLVVLGYPESFSPSVCKYESEKVYFNRWDKERN